MCYMDMLAKYLLNELINNKYILKYIQKNSLIRVQELVKQAKRTDLAYCYLAFVFFFCSAELYVQTLA